MATTNEVRDIWNGIDKVSDAAAHVTLSVERHVVECTAMRRAVDLRLEAIQRELAGLKKLVIWAAGIVIAVEALGLRAVVRMLVAYFNIPLPGG